MPAIDLSPYLDAASMAETMKVYGRIVEITGIIIKATGVRASIGESCRIFTDTGSLDAEVVGFRDGKALLMAVGEVGGIRLGNRVLTIGKKVSIRVSSSMKGRVMNDRGEPIDGKGTTKGVDYPLLASTPHPLKRRRISESIDLGIRAINGLLTCGKGQRIGIMAGSGVGKSVLLGMMARYTGASVNVIALIGERGREVREFIEKDLGREGSERSVVVVATSEQPPLAKVRAALAATALAEFFRDKGEDVLLLMDSLTRVAQAQREIGLAIGEPPTAKGYTPSVFALLPKLLERVGTSEGSGSITGIYTVLVEGDDLSEPVADSARAILDGHIVLSRELAMENHYPSIDVLQSISRVMPDIADSKHRELASKFVETLAIYKKFEDMISLGAYKEGSNPKVDYAIRMIDDLKGYLRQGMSERRDLGDSLQGLYFLFEGKEMRG
ncbi:MAG TPA: FliI/YscN family ATPase [Thermodesulfovibrionales bacterium]|nr:FliI/YscN family ATPase [Thermodesulfovibrionales bacterium]